MHIALQDKVSWFKRIAVLGLAALASQAADLPTPAPPAADESSSISFSLPGGVYTNSAVVRLSVGLDAARIFYTTDGSEPTERSQLYAEPLNLTNSTVLRARSFYSGKTGEVRVATYTLLDDSAVDFTSNLPIIIIDSFGQNLTHDDKTEISVRFIAPENGRSALGGTANWDGRASLHLRGHTSLRYPKRSFGLKLLDAQGHSQKAAILGLPPESDWILYAPYPDKTLLRDVLAYELSNRMGRYAPRTRFVEVFLNNSSGRLSRRQYLGVFVFEEKIKRGKERVPIHKLGPADDAEPAVTGGYIFKKDHMDRVELGSPNVGGFPNGNGPSNSNRDGFPTGPGGFPGDSRGFLPTEGQRDPNDRGASGRDLSRNRTGSFVSPHGSQFIYVEPKMDEITMPQRRWLSQYLRRLETALYGPSFRDPVNGYAAYLDVDSFIDYHWLVEATKNIDGFRFSTFFFKDREGKVQAGPIWDWNLSFGAANGKQGYMAQYWYWPQLDDQQYSWYRRLFEDPDFAQRYVDRWGVLRTNQLASAKILGRIDELAAELNEAQARNFKRWKILGRQVWPDYYTGKTYSDEVQYLKNWIMQRLDWIDHQFVAAPVLSFQPGKGNESKLVLRAGSGKIYYTLDGSDPRASGGGISPHAEPYKSPVLVKPQTTVTARVLEAKRWSWPARLSSGAPGISD